MSLTWGWYDMYLTYFVHDMALGSLSFWVGSPPWRKRCSAWRRFWAYAMCCVRIGEIHVLVKEERVGAERGGKWNDVILWYISLVLSISALTLSAFSTSAPDHRLLSTSPLSQLSLRHRGLIPLATYFDFPKKTIQYLKISTKKQKMKYKIQF